MVDLKLIMLWLKEAVEQRSPPILSCIIFGSALTRSNQNDVDIVIIFNEWYIRDILAELKLAFRTQFGLPLHIQIFYIYQIEHIKSFFVRASPTLEVI